MKHLGRYALVAVTLLLFASIVLNVTLFNRAQQYYLDLNAVRLDPLDLEAYPIASSAPSSKLRVIFFGDSRAARWPASAALDRVEAINRGVEAETSAQAALRFSAHVAPLHPNVVVVQVGVNDLKTIPLFPKRQAEIVAATKANIRHIVEQSTSLGAHVVLTTIFPVGDFPLERRMFWSPAIESAVHEVNDYLRSLSSRNVVILDAAMMLAQGERANPQYFIDELHLNDAGYAALNQELSNILSTSD